MRSFVMTMGRALATALVLAVAIVTAAAASLRGWRDGPAGGLLTEDEYRQFGALRTDAGRRTFIDRFWREIEADAGAPPDSYRKTFEQRCTAADERFRTGGQPGWQTDRGRVFVALGEPAEIRREPGGMDAIDKEVWSYSKPKNTESPLRIVFNRCLDGGYRLEASCLVERNATSVAYDGERADFVRRLRDENPRLANGRLFAMLDGLLVPVPGVPVRSHPAAASSGGASSPALAPPSAGGGPPGVHALEDFAYFFRAQDGTVLTLLSLTLLAAGDGISKSPTGGDAAYLGAASIEEMGRRGEDLAQATARTVVLDTVPGAVEGGRATFFGRVYLQSGRTYTVRYAVSDEAKDEVFVRDSLVGVPDLGRGFSASSIVPAEQFGPARTGAGRFQVGSEEVVPKTGGVFRRSELLRLYLQVYDAAIDPEKRVGRVDVVFRFYRSVNGQSKRYGKPFSVRGAAGASMGLALPIGDWPTGPYRVVVELHDRVAEERTTAEGAFSIVAE